MARCDSYTDGNCTKGACQLAPWIPDWLGDGGDWAAHWEQLGGLVAESPVPGSVVCYARGDGYSQFGHVAYVLSVAPDGTFLVREENFVGLGQFDDRQSNMWDVAGFLLPPPGFQGSGAGLTGPSGGGGADDVRQAWADLQQWLNGGMEWWINELNTTANLMNGIQ